MDTEWVLGYLKEARALAEGVDRTQYGWRNSEGRDEFLRRRQHIVTCAEKALTTLGKQLDQDITRGYWSSVRTTLDQALYALEDGMEVRRHLGPPPGPSLRADRLHPTVWDAATSLWRSEHYREAVRAASVAVNAQLQQKTGRRDIDNVALLEQSFSPNPPEAGAPRLRLWEDDGSDTFKNMHVGPMSFGRGCFMAIRNVGSHEVLDELDPQVALEQLAAFSVLARWIDDAELEIPPPPPPGSADQGVR